MSLTDKIAGMRKWKQRPEVLCCPPIPLPMHGLAPRVVLGKKWWDETRLEAYRSTCYHCVACACAAEHLEGHEVYDIDHLCGTMRYVETVPLCEMCHSYVHPGFMNVKLEQGIITRDEYFTIKAHGTYILTTNGLKPYEPYNGPEAEWGDWRLVVDGKEYPSLFRDFQAYRNHYEC